MPTNLGQLPTNQPIPNDRVQVKHGAVDTTAAVNSGTAGGTIIGDGAGGSMLISYTPTYACKWIVRANIMAHGWSDGAGWRRCDWAIYISPGDVNGITTGFQCPMQLYDASTVEWRSYSGSCQFRLAAGVTYSAYIGHAYCSGGTVDYHVGPIWCRIMGQAVSEGVL